MPTIPTETRRAVLDLLAEGKHHRDIAKRLGISTSTVSSIRNSDEAPEKACSTRTDEIAGDSWNISLPHSRICTLDELVAYCKIDLTIWEIERFVCNKWEVGAKVGEKGSEKVIAEPLFQVKAWLKKKRAVAFAKAQIAELKEEALRYSPKFTGFKPKKPNGSGVMAEYAPTDHHFGGLIWGEETGGADWDNKLAEEAWKDSFSTLGHRVRGYDAESALLVLGNDQQNADNRQGSTEKLTPQVMDSRYEKVFGISKRLSRWATDKLLAEYGRVHVVIVRGNHDPLAAWHLGEHLETWYRNCPGVSIDNSVPMRKYHEHGKVMLMFTHGNAGKLQEYDRVMAFERPEMWGRTLWREAHTGDKHQRKVIEQKGCTIRILPTLRPSCAWGAENLHIGSLRASEAFVWSKTEGLIGNATYAILGK